MSYDFFLMKLKRPVKSAQELGDETVEIIGDSRQVRDAISKVIPGIIWSEWRGALTAADSGWIQFSVPEDANAVNAIVVRTSHASNHNWERNILRQLCNEYGWTVYDHQTDAFVFPEQDTEVL
jgi:hypothetical protein